jgi:cell pole-organizing protein PopZ
MEEILASIRRIISEDEPPEGEAAAAPAETEPEPVIAAAEDEPAPPAEEPGPVAEPDLVAAAPALDAEIEDDDLELTQKVETHGDLDVVAPVTPAEPAASEQRWEPESVEAAPRAVAAAATVETLVSDQTAQIAASAFGQLSSSLLMPRTDRTLEDVVRELLRPMLQQWLDDNLPAIVQQAVQTEVERIARTRVR